MSDHLVNSWESVLSSSLDGDPIVALSWLHNGVKLALHVEMVTLTDGLYDTYVNVGRHIENDACDRSIRVWRMKYM